MLTLALSKGRIFDETLPLLKAAGIEVGEDPERSRKLILPTNRPDVRVVLVRATDVPTYVQHGGADLGVAGKDVHVDLIKLYGSMELAPLTGLADAIVDLVSTGSTLRANHLVEVEQIMEISSRLVVNQAALKLKREPIRQLIDAFSTAIN